MPQSTTTPLLRRGCQGQDVLDLQCSLAAAGVYTGNFDGGFGASTESALVAFQKQRKLAPSGVLDPATMQTLNLKSPKPTVCALPAITADVVAKLFSGTLRANIEANLPHVLNALAEEALADKQMLLVALATIRVETASFLPVSELPSPYNTSPGGKPFDLYDHRVALGNKGALDGEKFRGRGFIQLTGRANFLQFGKEIGIGEELITNPLKAHDPVIAAKILAAFLRVRESRIRTALAQNRLAEVRRLVNGGSNGLQQFMETFRLGMEILPDQIAA